MIDRSGWVANASSEERGEGFARHAIDGDPDTFWHSRWSRSPASHPHYFDLDLGKASKLTGLRYLPRQGSANGRISEYRVAISDDGKKWIEVATGAFANTASEKSVKFDSPVTARHMRLEAHGSHTGPWATAAEIIPVQGK
jgi:beta-galactosidase